MRIEQSDTMTRLTSGDSSCPLVLFNVLCDSIEHHYECWLNSKREITSKAYIGSDLHLSTPLCYNEEELKNIIAEFEKKLEEQNNIVEISAYNMFFKMKNPKWQSEFMAVGRASNWYATANVPAIQITTSK